MISVFVSQESGIILDGFSAKGLNQRLCWHAFSSRGLTRDKICFQAHLGFSRNVFLCSCVCLRYQFPCCQPGSSFSSKDAHTSSPHGLLTTWQLTSSNQARNSLIPIFFFFNILCMYVFIYLFWLRQVFVAARGVFIATCGVFSCCMRTLSCGMHAGSSPRPGVEPGPLHWERRVLSTGPQGSPSHPSLM